MTRGAKKPVPPFPIVGYYPSRISQWSIDLYNGTYNKLFPVHPLVFGASAAASYAYFAKNPTSQLLKYLPDLLPDSEVFKVAKLSAVSFATVYFPVFMLRKFMKYFIFSYKRFLFEKKPSLLTKLWAFCRHWLVRNPKLNSCDDLLPNLPLPALKDTVRRYLDSMEPLLSKDEFENLKEMSENFLKNEGRKLQFYAKIWRLFNSNYVTPFWEKYAYLMGRDQLMISSSVAHVDLFKDRPANQAVRAAHVVYIEALSMLGMFKQQLKPLANGLVCSNHYRRMYAGTRVPNDDIDHLESYRLSKHVAVYCNGCFYKVDLFDKNGKLHSLEYLYDVFTEMILRKETPLPGEEKLAALTFDLRTNWSKNRKRFFLENVINKESLKIIETSMVFLCLDPDDYEYNQEKPELLDYFMKSMLTGNGKNRWVDKSLNYIIGRSGRAGGTTEHSIGDGAEFDHIMENFVNVDVNFLKYPEVVNLETLTDFKPQPTTKLAERLKFDISDEMIGEIERCFNEYQPKKDDVDFAATIFQDFGKGLIKKGKCSPDAFVQMAIQLANFKDNGKFVQTYESASSRFYTNSRTETLRTVTKDSCAFVNAMMDPNSNNEERLKLLHKACETHGFNNRMCMIGQGVDRHMFVLYVLSRGLGLSSPFLDFYINQPWLLSTSQPPTLTNQIDEDAIPDNSWLGAPFLDFYINQPWLLSTSQPPTLTNQIDEDAVPDNSWLGACFGAVTKDGYGVCYRFAGNHSICIHITSYKSSGKTDAHRFQGHLKESFHEMAKLFGIDGVKL
uniref:Choline/carnitine acyltransferase domain-containing protein n=2 Tax=Panagrolaimus sp. JU765 TaxID=591449 RepID=A0AC34QNZ1_9BILA